MLSNKKILRSYQAGLSLVELMVGLVIGLLATLVIMQVFTTFEGQKRTTTGTADAQTNGSISLFTIQRDVQMAGFGLPMFDTQNPPLKCNPTVTVDHDGVGATPQIDLFPIRITNGGAGLSDVVAVRYSTSGAASKAGMTVKIIAPGVIGSDVSVDNNLACNGTDNVDDSPGVGDVALLSAGNACAMTKVTDTNANLAADITRITLASSAGAVVGGSISCMGSWNQFEYRIVSNQLQRNDAANTPAGGTPIISDIVNMQAQYGISASPGTNQITQWVDASGATWATPSVDNRNRIKAVHIAVVARNGLLEKTDVTETCTTAKGTVNNGPCAWDDSELPTAAPVINLSADANWKRYRYRVYDTIIPIRNMIWSKNTID